MSIYYLGFIPLILIISLILAVNFHGDDRLNKYPFFPVFLWTLLVVLAFIVTGLCLVWALRGLIN